MPMCADARARTALVVEDEALVRCLIVSLLQDHDWLVLEAGAGEDALDYLDHPIDVVFTDIQLAGSLNGWDVAEAARKPIPRFTSSTRRGIRRTSREKWSGAGSSPSPMTRMKSLPHATSLWGPTAK
jgi:DNA-binding LytR/AlgR family response regulator